MAFVDDISMPGLFDPATGRDLAFFANSHLFDWPGELLYGPDARGMVFKPMAPDPGIELHPDWDYERSYGSTAPFRSEKGGDEDIDAPADSIYKLRRVLDVVKQSETYPDPSPFRPGFAAPTMAQAWKARQSLSEHMALDRFIPNPLIEELGIRSLDNPGKFDQDPDAVVEGSHWILSKISVKTIGFALLKRKRIQQWGVECAVQIAWNYWVSNKNEGEVERDLYSELKNVPLITKDIQIKLKQIESEQRLWANRARMPVVTPEGKTDRLITLANLSTGLIGVYLLYKLGSRLTGIQAGLEKVQEILEG